MLQEMILVCDAYRKVRASQNVFTTKFNVIENDQLLLNTYENVIFKKQPQRIVAIYFLLRNF